MDAIAVREGAVSRSDLSILLAYLTLLLAFSLAHLWWWVGLLGGIGLVELLARLVSGQTLSQQVKQFNRDHPRGRWVLAGGLGGALLLLWIHLAR